MGLGWWGGEGEPGLFCIHLPQWVSITHPLPMLRDFTNLILSLITAVLLDKEDESQNRAWSWFWLPWACAVSTPWIAASQLSLKQLSSWNNQLCHSRTLKSELRRLCGLRSPPLAWECLIGWSVTREKWTFYKGTAIIGGGGGCQNSRSKEAWGMLVPREREVRVRLSGRTILALSWDNNAV